MKHKVIRMKDEEAKMIKNIAANRMIPQTAIIRDAIMQYLKTYIREEMMPQLKKTRNILEQHKTNLLERITKEDEVPTEESVEKINVYISKVKDRIDNWEDVNLHDGELQTKEVPIQVRVDGEIEEQMITIYIL